MAKKQGIFLALDIYNTEYTLNSARLLKWDDRVGVVAPGYFADIIAVRGSPLQDIAELEDVDFVMKGGVVYKHQ